MSNDLVKFTIPADFVVARCWPRAGELAYGLRHGWLEVADAVRIAEREMAAGLRLTRATEELALLLRAEHARAQEVLALVSESDDDKNLWIYLALAWLRENRDHVDDPFAVVDMLYADFDYPEQMEGLVRFMPAPAGAPRGLPAIDARWRSFLAEWATFYRDRPWEA